MIASVDARISALTWAVLVWLTVGSVPVRGQVPTPSPSPQEKREIQHTPSQTKPQPEQQRPQPESQRPRDTKPELVLQTGYSASSGAARLVFSPDGRLLATSTFHSGIVKLWETATGRELRNITASALGAASSAPLIAFSGNNHTLATASADSPIRIWDVITGQQLQTLPVPAASFIAFAGNDRTLVTISDHIRIWDLTTQRELRKLEPTPLLTDSRAAISSDGRQLAIIAQDASQQLIKVFDLTSGRESLSLNLPDTGRAQLAFTVDGRLLISSIVNKQLQLLEVTATHRERVLAHTTQDQQAIEFSLDGRLLALSEGTRVRLWDVLKGRELGTLKLIDAAGPSSQTRIAVAFSADGQRVATGGINSPTVVWEAKSGKQLLKLSGRTNPAYDVAFSSDGNRLFSGGRTIWDLKTGRGLRLLNSPAEKMVGSHSPDVQLLSSIDPNKRITHSAFSRDGQLLAASTLDNTIKIWDVRARSELRTLSGIATNINSLAFSPNSRLLASAGDDGSTVLWDAETGAQLLTLISLDDGSEWITVTPQGVFDGTPTSWNQILWRYNQDTFNVAPIEWFFTEFYHPGLLADVFAGKRPRVADDVSRKDRRQPIVKLSFAGAPAEGATSSRTVKVKLEITDAAPDKENPQGAGARDLRLFRNGLLVKVWPGDLLKGKSVVTLEQKVTITAGLNRLTAYAFNRDNVKSKDAVLAVTGAETLKRSGTAYIIAVGINEYENPQYNLKYAVADAQSFAEELRRRLPDVSHFDRIEVVPLINDSATKANILSALQKLSGASGESGKLRRAEPEDTVVIYFAGHGTAHGQRFYLIPHDLGYTGERTALDEEGLQSILSHSISDIEIEQAVEGMDAGHLLLFIDACNSGQALEAEEKRRGPMNSKGLAQLAYEKGMYILTAAQSYQAAIEAARFGHGLLTYALVEEGLKTPVADTTPPDGVLTARELLDFATERVPQMQEEKMKESRGVGLGIAFVDGEQTIADPGKRSVQRPRVFYRRELESNPLVVARSGKPPATAKSALSNPNIAPSGLSRWFDLQTATLGMRYRFVENSQSVTVVDQLQSFAQFKGRFKFDRAGNYSINAGVFTGNSFVVGFNDTGIGTGDLITNLYLKQLYFSAKPVSGIELQFGGLYFNRGESTEITTYDNDGYLMGERVVIQKPRSLFFDEISATYGFLGDLSTPNINKRWHRLKKSNYHQFLVSKRIGERAIVSADYTFESGRDTLRQALRVNTPEFKPLDFFRVEVYQRVKTNPEAGLAAYGEKSFLKKRLTLGGGYAQIDADFGGLNGDRFNRGKRVFFISGYKLTPELTVTTFYTRAFKNDFPVVNKTRFEIFVTYNLLKIVKF